MNDNCGRVLRQNLAQRPVHSSLKIHMSKCLDSKEIKGLAAPLSQLHSTLTVTSTVRHTCYFHISSYYAVIVLYTSPNQEAKFCKHKTRHTHCLKR